MRVVMGHYLFCSIVYILFITNAPRNGQITTRVTEYYWVVRPSILKQIDRESRTTQSCISDSQITTTDEEILRDEN